MKQHDSLVGSQPKNNCSFFKKISIAALVMAPLLSVYSQENLALNKPVVASSANYPAVEAVDGNAGTRWQSLDAEPQASIYIDLGASYSIGRIVIDWEGAYASSYKIQISEDTDFSEAETVSTLTKTAKSKDDLTIVDKTGRYVRIECIEKGTPWPYSIWEIEVYEAAPTQQLGVDSVQGEGAPTVAVYPNPASDYVKLSFPEKLNNTVVTVYDISGKQLIQNKLDDAAEESTININQLAKGTYILNIKSEGKNWSKKLIKE